MRQEAIDKCVSPLAAEVTLQRDIWYRLDAVSVADQRRECGTPWYSASHV